jgi:hypothetical protein
MLPPDQPQIPLPLGTHRQTASYDLPGTISSRILEFLAPLSLPETADHFIEKKEPFRGEVPQSLQEGRSGTTICFPE